MKLPEIIGIAGTNGAGKDTLAYLRETRQGVQRTSASDLIRQEATKRGLVHTRENLRAISTEWSHQLGAGGVVLMALEQYWEKGANTGLSIVSIRRPAEAAVIQQQGGVIVWVDAPRDVRYARIVGGARGRLDDQVTFEEFCAQEDYEMYPANDDDPFSLNMAGVREMADVRVANDFATEELYEEYLVRTFEL